ncbi:MAG: hypothetical protein IJB48_02195 [Clostridia bacterium]|nr:hypothetical protein [Clostridia bacterium]
MSTNGTEGVNADEEQEDTVHLWSANSGRDGVCEESESEIANAEHNRENLQPTEKRNIETEYGTEREGISTGTSFVREGGGPNDRVSKEESNSIREKGNRGSGFNNIGNDKRTRDDGDAKGQVVSARVKITNEGNVTDERYEQEQGVGDRRHGGHAYNQRERQGLSIYFGRRYEETYSRLLKESERERSLV